MCGPRANPLMKEMHKQETSGQALLEATAEALNEHVLALMLLAVQKNNLDLSVQLALKR